MSTSNVRVSIKPNWDSIKSEIMSIVATTYVGRCAVRSVHGNVEVQFCILSLLCCFRFWVFANRLQQCTWRIYSFCLCFITWIHSYSLCFITWGTISTDCQFREFMDRLRAESGMIQQPLSGGVTGPIIQTKINQLREWTLKTIRNTLHKTHTSPIPGFADVYWEVVFLWSGGKSEGMPLKQGQLAALQEHVLPGLHVV